MDREQQVRLNFLEEAEQYYDRMESVLIGLADRGAEPHQLDELLRLAHSVKGGAGMMGFMPLSQVAHRLEDFLKILRARHQSQPLDHELETWLLRGVDCLRQIGELHRQGGGLEPEWFEQQTQPLFARLQARLGDLRPEDENALLAEEEEVDVSLILFENGVEEALDRFESRLTSSSSAGQLAQDLQATANELVTFGRMRDLDVFIQLCQIVGLQAKEIAPTQVEELAKQALKLWRQSLGLVSLGRPEQIPNYLSLGEFAGEISVAESQDTLANQNGVDPFAFTDLEIEISEFDFEHLATELDSTWVSEDLSLETQLSESVMGQALDNIPDEDTITVNYQGVDAPDIHSSSVNDLDLSELEAVDPDINDLDINDLDMGALDISNFTLDTLDLTGLELPELELPELTLDVAELTDLQQTFAQFETEAVEALDSGEQASDSVLTDVATSQDAVIPMPAAQPELLAFPASEAPVGAVSNSSTAPEASGKTVRVPLDQLQRFNTLFSGLVLERNAINLRLDQMKGFVSLLRDRMYRLEQSNTQLRKWYDRASLEGIVSTPGTAGNLPAEPSQPVMIENPLLTKGLVSTPSSEQFDALEMDRYTDLHLLSQEQMETIVQLQEVMTDVEFSLREMGQAVQGLNQSTRSVQDSATRMQMRPFSDLVGRFPRAVRDWSMKFGKSVSLKLEGDATLLDRDVIENLSDPLLHLLRNAFDHGIESPESRISAGKPAQGTITLRAAHQGNKTLITISDDGQGINLDKVRAQARKQGFPESLLRNASEKDLLELIFEPGFSTAEQVSELSGRGVGMDVVKTNLLALRGEIDVATRAGIGTTFTISLPFNLSILPVLLLENADMVFSIAADSVREVLRPTPDQLVTIVEQEHLSWNGHLVPLVRLEQWLGYRRPSKPFLLEGTPSISQSTILLVGQDANLRGVYVDRVWGEQEVAIRPITSPLPLPPGFFSTSLLGDGRVVPLVDLVPLTAWITEGKATPNVQIDLAKATQTGMSFLNQSMPILVVDDSINVRRYLAMVLEEAGYQVEQARDGRDAVEQLAGGLKVQAVICDIEMPRLDGYGVLTELRAQAAFADLPIAMLTSRSGEKHRKMAMNLGASAYLSKPCTDQELLSTLEGFIAKQQMSVV
jgi:chemosensory pili system protein ChpA (sensor histidine kinase/response regulator)